MKCPNGKVLEDSGCHLQKFPNLLQRSTLDLHEAIPVGIEGFGSDRQSSA